MTPIKAQIKKLEFFLKNFDSIAAKEAKKHADYIAELNREQLLRGEKGDGNMPNYKPNSKQPSAPGKITLFDKGVFHNSITTEISNEGYENQSSDEKSKYLMKYGNILSLNQESKEKLRKRLMPGIIERYKNL